MGNFRTKIINTKLMRVNSKVYKQIMPIMLLPIINNRTFVTKGLRPFGVLSPILSKCLWIK